MNESIYIQYDMRAVPDSDRTGLLIRLEQRFPGMVRENASGTLAIQLDTSGDDVLVAKLLGGLKDLGVDISAWDYLQSGFGASINRNYNVSELDAFRYLHSCDAGGTYLGEVEYPLICDPHGVPALAGKPRQKARLLGTPEPLHPSFFVVRGEAKEKLEGASFNGLQLHPVVFNRARSLAAEDRLWAVWSDLVLPPMKNLFRTDAGEMGFAKEVMERAKNAGPAKGFLTKPEIHYRKDDFDAFGEFDVALMREPLKIHGTLSPRPVFSQRFGRFVIDELGVPLGGVPVCIDDDDIIPWEGPYPSKWSHLNRRPEWLEKLQAEVSEGK
ncbi:MAG: hypothetical protein EOP84_16910 [Verrucomicrobiaceae bacterium]|nr:MAG: hypothetical protein EOP84_16910 [Verrucomicrobiaceae bacterium]